MNLPKKPVAKSSNLEKTLRVLTARRELPKATVIIFILIYGAMTFLTVQASRTDGNLMFGNYSMPIRNLTAVLSSIGNICIIFMTLFYDKLGYILCLVLLVLVQLPMLIISIIKEHNPQGIPGIFSNLFSAIAITIIFLNNRKIQKYQEKLRKQAATDVLTGLPNRFAGGELLSQLIKKENKFALVSIDLNNFKSINETMGQETGNSVLKEVASRWMNIANNGESGTVDFITRLSGDEFSVLVRGYYSEAELIKSIKCYEDALERKITIDECDFYITASFGYAEFPTDADTGDTLISCSDAAMHAVKLANSSDHIMHFKPEMLKIGRTLEIEREIRGALEEDRIFFNLQPQFDMSHKLRGFEALARMKGSDGSIISPGEFIPVAEKVGLIDKVDGTVFRKSAEFIGDIIKRTHADVTLSVNVSVRHLMKNDFLKEVREVIEKSGIPANQLEIEITESIMIDSYEKALNVIGEIKKMGIKIAIDDFGTGYSSLSYLHRFPADLLKIDKSFIDKMNSGESSKKYVASIISIGHIMNFNVISEGVESPDQLDTLRSIGCDYIQGFIWGRPLPKEEAEKLVLGSV